MNVESLQKIVMSVTCEHSVECVLETIARRLAEEPGMALVRLWLLGDGDVCTACTFREECPDRSRCLHLVASAGNPLGEGDWSGIDGDYRRFPIGIRKVGRIASTRQPVLLSALDPDRSWIREQEWVEREGIKSFAGQPLLFRGEVLGVLAVFSRSALAEDALIILRAFADHAAAAIANARAFEEIERLQEKLELENEYLRGEVETSRGFGAIVGGSSAIRKVQEQIDLVAPTGSSVLIAGETGTGKELVAQAIHDRSARGGKPLIRVNCAAIPHDLFESEFFGHARGAFTGATVDRMGRFELANGGTLFLDEVGEIPLELQPKLLRVLQEGQLERVGENKTRHVDVRVIAATNRDLKAESAAHRFRQDLYYRLSVFPIDVPPLRERREDIPELAAHFLASACARFNLPEPTLKRRHVAELQGYDWPGNVRELQNVVERAAIRAQAHGLEFNLSPESPTAPARPQSDDAPGDILTQEDLRVLERANLLRALERTDGKIGGRGGAAELLGMKPTTMASKLRVFGIERTK